MTATINTEAVVARARQLLHAAADASKQLEESVRELVAMRAWEALGYENFSDMWEIENGFACPTYIQVLAVEEASKRHPASTVAKNIFPAHLGDRAKTVRGIQDQLEAGVPLAEVIKGGRHSDGVINKIARYNDRVQARPRPRRVGTLPEEMVSEGFNIQRVFADQVADIARHADVPKAEIYRQAVAEYLMRHRESRPDVSS